MLTAGGIAKLKTEGNTEPVTVKVINLQKQTETKYRCSFTDGTQSTRGVIASQYTELITNGQIVDGTILNLTAYVKNEVNGDAIVIATALDVISTPTSSAEPVKAEPVKAESATDADQAADEPPLKVLKSDHDEQPELSLGPIAEDKSAPTVSRAAPKTPGLRGVKESPEFSFTPEVTRPVSKENVAPSITPGPTPSPSEMTKVNISFTPRTDTKSAPATPSGPLSKIAALHPYDDQWSIKAKVSRKYPLRSFTRNGNENKVMTLELIDDQGTAIQASMWRQAVDKYADTLQEGKVYTFTRFQVKPANKQYSQVKNDYEIHMDNRTAILECEDQGEAANMTAAIDITPIDQLTKFLTRKVTVDVMGVVVAMTPVDTVKRKADGSEMMRRDITIADQSNFSVTLTLWQENATALPHSLVGSVVVVSCCRVTDFKGCSLSTLTRSTVTIDPETPEAVALKDWFNTTAGSAHTFTPIGQSVDGNRGSQGGASGASAALGRLKDLEVPADQVPPVDAKPKYTTVLASVAHIPPDQTLYYLANPENGRKVVEQNGKYYSEADGKVVDTAEHRYVMQAKAIDSSGEVYVSLFNKEAEEVLGAKADVMAGYKAAGDIATYGSVLKAAQWGEWVMTISSKSREYNGDLKLRHTVVNVRPVNFLVEGQRLLDVIKLYD